MTAGKRLAVSALALAGYLHASRVLSEPKQETVRVSLGPCLSEEAARVAQTLRLELHREVAIVAAGQAAQASVSCEGDALVIRTQAQPWTRRTLEPGNVDARALGRTVALALVAELEMPLRHPVAQQQASSAQEPRRQPRASVVLAAAATSRQYWRAKDVTLGVALESELPLFPAGQLMLGVSADQGRTERELGQIVGRTLLGRLGMRYRLAAGGPFSLAAQAFADAGAQSMTGYARGAAVQEDQLRGAYSSLSLQLVPTLRVVDLLQFQLRAGAGWVLLGLEARVDNQIQQVQRGGFSCLEVAVGIEL